MTRSKLAALLPGVFALMLGVAAGNVAFAQAQPQAQPLTPEQGDDKYKPSVGQPGKDVVWVPTPDELVRRMLQAAKVTDKDLVYDLGAGDGKIAIAAGRDFGATAIGIEYNPEMAALAQRNAQRAGVADKVKIIQGDIFVEDFTKATVVTLYLLPDLNFKLRPILLKMTPGTRVVSHQFNMREWEPDETMKIEYRDAYLWIVPAQVGGKWALKEERGKWTGSLDMTQQFQKVGGVLTIGGKSQVVLSPVLKGDELSFSFTDPDGTLRQVQAKVNGNMLDGSLRNVGYGVQITGRRTSDH